MHTIVYSLPASRGTGSLRYSNSLEPLRELETVRIKLVKDFIDEKKKYIYVFKNYFENTVFLSVGGDIAGEK